MTKKPNMTLDDDDATKALFDAARRVRTAKPRLDLPRDVPTCVITCRVCSARDTIAVDWVGLLCRTCRADLNATRRRVEQLIADYDATERIAFAQWQSVCDEMTDELRERWERLVARRVAVEMQINRALRGPRASHLTNAQLNQMTFAAVEAQRLLDEQLDATRQSLTHPLSSVLRAEDAYLAISRDLASQKNTQLRALDELSAVEQNIQLPF